MFNASVNISATLVTECAGTVKTEAEKLLTNAAQKVSFTELFGIGLMKPGLQRQNRCHVAALPPPQISALVRYFVGRRFTNRFTFVDGFAAGAPDGRERGV